jgi:uncharacterized coiled-coil protein SlyX
MDNNKQVINILKNIESRLANIESRLDNIESTLANIESRYNRMDNHLDLVEDVYYKMRLPLDYFIDRINKVITNTEPVFEIDYTNEID